MKKISCIFLILILLFSCNQETKKGFDKVLIKNYNSYLIPEYLSEYRIDTLNSSEVLIQFRNSFKKYFLEEYKNLTYKDRTSLSVYIHPFKGDKIQSINDFHYSLSDKQKSDIKNSESKQLVSKEDIGISLFVSYYKTQNNEKFKNIKYFKHFINYSDSVEIKISFDFLIDNDSISNQLIKEAVTSVNFIDCEKLSRMKYNL